MLLVVAVVLAAAGRLSACPACLDRDHLRALSLESIKREILAKLGFERAPNLAGKFIPPFPPDLDLDLEDHGAPHHPHPQEPLATTKSIIAFAQPKDPGHKIRHTKKKHEVLYFSFSELVQEVRVQRARLHLYLVEEPEARPAPINVTVYLMNRGSSDEKAGPRDTAHTSIQEAWGQGNRWVTVDMKTVVQHWFRAPRENAGIVVKTTGPGVVLTNTNSTEHVPYLQVNTTDNGRKSRSKRSLSFDCQENSTDSHCCRYPLSVNFEEFGWDWIIAPKKYDAYYCSGECGYSSAGNVHSHVVQSMSNKTTACCAARKMSDISMLFFDDKTNIIFSRLPDMVVDRCGCL